MRGRILSTFKGPDNRTLTDTQNISTWTPTNRSSLCRSGIGNRSPILGFLR